MLLTLLLSFTFATAENDFFSPLPLFWLAQVIVAESESPKNKHSEESWVDTGPRAPSSPETPSDPCVLLPSEVQHRDKSSS